MPKLNSGGYIGISTIVDFSASSSGSGAATGVFNLHDQAYWQRIAEWPTRSPVVKATGGTYQTSPGNGYRYHTFIGPGTLTMTTPSTVDVLMVAGGGGNNTEIAGGGGGGGLLYGSLSLNTGDAFSVTIGDGGGSRENGENTTISAPGGNYVAVGGGYGGGYAFHVPTPVRYGSPGGCGGGQGGAYSGYPQEQTATGTQAPDTAPYGTLTGFGNPGGTGSPSPYSGSGGGGCGAAGQNASPDNNTGGNGGIGKQYPEFTGPLIGVTPIAPENGYFGGGGGGNAYPSLTTNGNGGQGGGGHGYGPDPVHPFPSGRGVAYTGGGSGGGPYSGYQPVTVGGEGIVVFRYPSS